MVKAAAGLASERDLPHELPPGGPQPRSSISQALCDLLVSTQGDL
jgi:hypothetical protein